MNAKGNRRKRTDSRNSRSDEDTENEGNDVVPGDISVDEDRVKDGYESESNIAKGCEYCI